MNWRIEKIILQQEYCDTQQASLFFYFYTEISLLKSSFSRRLGNLSRSRYFSRRQKKLKELFTKAVLHTEVEPRD